MLRLTIILVTLFQLSTFVKAQQMPDSLGLAGDNLNLYAVLALFQQNISISEFEKQLNNQQLHINNLDLNNDDVTDFIKVTDYLEGSNHAITLHAMINEPETQHLATIEIAKDESGMVTLQIVGAEVLYGRDYIIEPGMLGQIILQNNEHANGDGVLGSYNYYLQQNNNALVGDLTQNQIKGFWPIISYLYSPNYVPYTSPWKKDLMPAEWQSWAPWKWHEYASHHQNSITINQQFYHAGSNIRSDAAHQLATINSHQSPLVHNNKHMGVYQKTYRVKKVKLVAPKPATAKPSSKKAAPVKK